MARKCFRAYDLTLDCDRWLGGLLPASHVSPDCTVTFADPLECDQAALVEWFHRWPERMGEPESPDWLKLGEFADCYVLRFPCLADFFLSQDGTSVTCCPADNVPFETLEHLLLDQVVPLILASRGRCVLHASAVTYSKNCAIAFAAPTGFGKSTLVAAIVRWGYQLLTDDGLLLRECEQTGELECIASYPGVRLWTESADQLFGLDAEMRQYTHYSGKRRIALEENSLSVHEGSAHLTGIYFLGPPSPTTEIQIIPLTERQAFLALMQQSFVLDPRNAKLQKGSFERFTRLAKRRMFFQLNYPRQWSELPKVVEEVLKHASRR